MIKMPPAFLLVPPQPKRSNLSRGPVRQQHNITSSTGGCGPIHSQHHATFSNTNFSSQMIYLGLIEHSLITAAITCLNTKNPGWPSPHTPENPWWPNTTQTQTQQSKHHTTKPHHYETQTRHKRHTNQTPPKISRNGSTFHDHSTFKSSDGSQKLNSHVTLKMKDWVRPH